MTHVFDQLRLLPTAAISDALDREGIPGALAGIGPLSNDFRAVGPAFTVQGIGGDNLALHRAVATAPAGSVLVVDLQGAAHGHWGEILAVAAIQRGILGLVVDGGVRDSTELAALGFPVFARHVTVVGTSKEHPGRFGVPVRAGAAVIRPGDLVVGDADGVVTIPASSVDKALELADARVLVEKQALEAIRTGVTTMEYYKFDLGETPA